MEEEACPDSDRWAGPEGRAGGGAVSSITLVSLRPFLNAPPLPAHCLVPDRKPGRPERAAPESERRLFLLLPACFLLTPAAILYAPGGPALIRVPA